ncbi:hypothetical protein W02_31900 [Nitrospira sp. KM1]|nr:hypothetical protein W02_31900 [Nitrospira sp. KM1]
MMIVKRLRQAFSLPLGRMPRVTFCCAIHLLCVGVMLTMLGTTISFWNLDEPDDLFGKSVLEGFAVVPDSRVLIAFVDAEPAVAPPVPPYRYLQPSRVFHPPVSSL